MNNYVRFLIPLVVLLNGCSFLYVMKQGVYQLDLLAHAEPIETALRSKDLDHVARKKLELIRDVRAYAKKRLSLVTDKNYKDVNLSFHHPIHVVSASYPLKFKAYQWWFPIIGSVPYKGYFDESDADLEEARLKKEGFDTIKREVQGYSTLGFFSDPVWPSMLKMRDDRLIELIIHELAHRTLYFPNQTPFNETFANFVGKKGAISYIKERYGDKSPELKNVTVYYQQLKIYQDFFHNLYSELDKLFNSNIPEEEIKTKKESTLENAKIDYQKSMQDGYLKNIDWSQINNAYIMSFKTYNQDDVIFAKLLEHVNGDFGKFIEEVSYYGRTKEPYISLRARLNSLGERQ